jgi:hypothetical protein
MRKNKKDEINEKKEFILLDIRGTKLSIADEIAFSVPKGRGGSRLSVGFISMIKKCDKTVVVNIKSKTLRPTRRAFYYSSSNQRTDCLLKLERGFVFDLDKPEFAKLFAEKIKFLSENPDIVESSSEDEDFGLSEIGLKE